MSSIFRTRLRNIGTSKGVLIPLGQLKTAEVNVGDEIELAILTHKKDFSGFGMTKQFKFPFVRDKKTREL